MLTLISITAFTVPINLWLVNHFSAYNTGHFTWIWMNYFLAFVPLPAVSLWLISDGNLLLLLRWDLYLMRLIIGYRFVWLFFKINIEIQGAKFAIMKSVDFWGLFIYLDIFNYFYGFLYWVNIFDVFVIWLPLNKITFNRNQLKIISSLNFGIFVFNLVLSAPKQNVVILRLDPLYCITLSTVNSL